MIKAAGIILICFLPLQTVSAQTENISKWSFSGSIIPHLTGTYETGPEKGLGVSLPDKNGYPAINPIPAIDFKIEYALLKRLSLQAGIGYVVYKTDIIKYNIYLEEFDDISGDGAENASIHILELPASINYYILDKKHYRFYVSLGDVSSFAIAETNAGDFGGIGTKKVQTTIYQNYLQFALGLDIKTKHTWDLYFSPLYRMSMVNYYDTKHYDIYAYPNVFYERMLGLEIGMKFNKLKKKS